MAQINAYLTFNGNCREAMTFYKECFGGELVIMDIKGSPVESEMPAEMLDKVMHSSLSEGKRVMLMASDMASEKLIHGTTVSIIISCENKEEIETMFSKLSKDAKDTVPLKTEFWGDTYGEVTDKYGFRWMLNFGANAMK